MPAEEVFRLLFAGILLAGLGISGYFRTKARRATGTISRGAESRGLILMRVAVTGPLLLTMGAYLFQPEWIVFARLPLPTAARWLGVGLGLACVPFLYWVFTSIGSNISETVLTKQTHQLVTHGPYRWIRHPLYTGGILLLASLSLISGSGLLLAFSMMGGLALPRIIAREEAELTARFGRSYQNYMDQTGRMLPRNRSGFQA